MGSVDRSDDPSDVIWLDADWSRFRTARGSTATWAARPLDDRDDRIELLDGTGFLTRLERRIVWIGAKLTASPTDDLRGFHSLDVTFRVHRPAAEAVDALDDADAIEWGSGHRPSRLSIRGRRPRRGGVRGPALVDAV